MQTQEFSKNPVIKARVRCGTCRGQFDIVEMIKEESMPYPNVEIVEGFLLCPDCGHRTHNYYMTEALRQDQVRLKEAILKWQKERTPAAWRYYMQRQQVFQNNYDRTQERLGRQFTKELNREKDNA